MARFLNIGYSLEDISYSVMSYENISYEYICNLFFELVHDNKMRSKLEDILYDGKCGDFIFDSFECGHTNAWTEARRRISMAYILIRNPDTFEVLVQNKVNLFHGTNSNALPSILKYGLNSGAESEKMGINVATGEKWSRIGGRQRDFVSLTDVFDVAENYSSIGINDGNFPVIVGTSTDVKHRYVSVSGEVPEVGVRGKISLDGIRMIGVPSDKVSFVRSLLTDDSIKVVAIDDICSKFCYVDMDSYICIKNEKFNKLKERQQTPKNKLIFKLEEIRNLMVERLLVGMRKNKVVVKEEENVSGRGR